MMSRFILKAFLLTCLSCLAAAQDAGDEFTIQRLLQRYTEAYGGLRDANRLTSISIEGVQIQGGQQYTFHIRKKRPNSMRYQLERGDATLTSVYNGERGWLQMKQAGKSSTEELAGSKLKVLKGEARFESPLYRYQEKPENRISLEGLERVGGIEAYVLRVEEPDASPCLYYLHPQSSHVLRIDRLDETGKTVFQTLYRNYKEVSGYPFAHEIENRENGETVSLTRVESVLVNPGLLSFYFENPET
jgi:hypothetical protein